VIAHRLSTIVDADQIVVLERGVVTQKGNHHELIQQEGLYSRLYREQFRVALTPA
jgi:ABC-type multidrug transport system fused ATPase/permease subunit